MNQPQLEPRPGELYSAGLPLQEWPHDSFGHLSRSNSKYETEGGERQSGISFFLVDFEITLAWLSEGRTSFVKQLDWKSHLWEYEGIVERPGAPSPMEVTAKTRGNTEALEWVWSNVIRSSWRRLKSLKSPWGHLTGPLRVTAGTLVFIPLL